MVFVQEVDQVTLGELGKTMLTVLNSQSASQPDDAQGVCAVLRLSYKSQNKRASVV